MTLPKPRVGAFEINLNTALLFLTLLATGAGWGIGYNALVEGRDTNARNIERLETRLSAVETTTRVLDRHELRIATVEAQARDAATAMRAVEQALSALASDMRVTREIVQRLEARGNTRPP